MLFKTAYNILGRLKHPSLDLANLLTAEENTENFNCFLKECLSYRKVGQGVKFSENPENPSKIMLILNFQNIS